MPTNAPNPRFVNQFCRTRDTFALLFPLGLGQMRRIKVKPNWGAMSKATGAAACDYASNDVRNVCARCEIGRLHMYEIKMGFHLGSYTLVSF